MKRLLIVHVVMAAAVLAMLPLVACSSSTTPAEDVVVDVVDNGTPVDTILDVVPDIVVVDVAVDSDVTVDPDVAPVDVIPEIYYPPVEPPLPFGPENRGYVAKRGIVHVHSRWSHDGCFPQHEDITSADIVACDLIEDDAAAEACKVPLREALLNDCATEYRDAPCADGIDFMFQTDHPGDVRNQTYENALHFRSDAGDVMVKDLQDRPFANQITCAEGSAVDKFFVYFGTEGSKQMPIGMAEPIPDIVYNTSFENSTPLVDAQAAIQVIHDLGGWALACHTEQDDIDAQRIIDLPLDIMEIFNFHPALMVIITDINILFQLDRFMSSDANAPNPDLSMLTILAPVANDPIRFDVAAQQIRLSHILATDIHRNVEIPKLCETAESCGDNWIATYPNLARLLATGGPAILGDGDRMDSYHRTLRWGSNHALVAGAAGPLEIRDAIGLGRSFSAFDVMGMPSGFDFFAVVDGTTAVEMGAEAVATPDVKVYFRTPTVTKPAFGSDKFGDPADADIVTKLIQIDEAGGSRVVAEVIGQGWTYEYTVDGPAVFRIEVWMTPKHLAADLGDMSSFAQKQYPWIYSNAVFIR